MQDLIYDLKPLKRVSPSRYTAMKKCPLKVILANSIKNPLLPYSPLNHFGNVIHECFNLIANLKIRTEKEFEDQWNLLIAKEEQVISAMGFDFNLPIKDNVPGYTIKKLQVKEFIKPKSKSLKKIDVSILSEKWLESKDTLVGGYADVIKIINGKITLSDFKSGRILREDGGIKEDYADQLKLYAYLYNETYSKYPDQLSIFDLNQKEYIISFSPAQCEILAQDSKKLLKIINHSISQNEEEKLANPSEENCLNCLYRPACRFSWTFDNNSNSPFTDIKGLLKSIKQFRNGNLSVKLEKDQQELVVSGLSELYLPFLDKMDGKEIAFYNVIKEESQNRFKVIKTTKVYEGR